MPLLYLFNYILTVMHNESRARMNNLYTVLITERLYHTHNFLF